MAFSSSVLTIDAPAVAREIEGAIRSQVLGTLRRKGVVVGVSGGIDSSVVMSLATRALGKEKVLAVLMPERDSSSTSLELGMMLVKHLEIPSLVEDIRPALEGAGCYERQNEAIRTVFPDYGTTPGWKCKVSLPSILESDRLNVTMLTIQRPDGTMETSRMPPAAYLKLIAATNFKQRIRTLFQYYHADRLAYAVGGTPNHLEYDQGFFVKQGDGAADIKPIAHLYKTQVFELAAYLGVPAEIRSRPPTTDTYSMPQTQEEFYFALPYDKMDLCLYGRDHGIAASEVGAAVGLDAMQVERVYKDIEAKRRVARYLHAAPLLVPDASAVK